MQSENATPIEERYLLLEGRISPSSLDLIKAGLPTDRPPNSEIIFVSFAYADLPFSKRFVVIFPKGRPRDGVRAPCEILAATQQFSFPLEFIPHGWKTICQLHFPLGMPDLIQQLPVVDAWYQNNQPVCICDEETWSLLKNLA